MNAHGVRWKTPDPVWCGRSLPNYANSLIRLGFPAEEVAEVSDRVFDAMIAWGDEEAIARRVREHARPAPTMSACRSWPPTCRRSRLSSGGASPPPWSDGRGRRCRHMVLTCRCPYDPRRAGAGGRG
ncbi:hypothetical protein FAIPA1_50075 [Frankia sp. AiPs1]